METAMSTVSKITEQSYGELISCLSDVMPKHGLERADLTLRPDELDIVIRQHGGGQFVNDALSERCGRSESDTFEAIAIRATASDINTALTGCGLAVIAALMDLATHIVLRDIEALRDLERPSEYDLRQQDAELLESGR
jgi:hypothetical protein